MTLLLWKLSNKLETSHTRTSNACSSMACPAPSSKRKCFQSTTSRSIWYLIFTQEKTSLLRSWWADASAANATETITWPPSIEMGTSWAHCFPRKISTSAMTATASSWSVMMTKRTSLKTEWKFTGKKLSPSSISIALSHRQKSSILKQNGALTTTHRWASYWNNTLLNGDFGR